MYKYFSLERTFLLENFCDFEEKNDKILLGKLIIHAADLSNPVRPFHVTKKWAENIARLSIFICERSIKAIRAFILLIVNILFIVYLSILF